MVELAQGSPGVQFDPHLGIGISEVPRERFERSSFYATQAGPVGQPLAHHLLPAGLVAPRAFQQRTEPAADGLVSCVPGQSRQFDFPASAGRGVPQRLQHKRLHRRLDRVGLEIPQQRFERGIRLGLDRGQGRRRLLPHPLPGTRRNANLQQPAGAILELAAVGAFRDGGAAA